MRGFDCGFFAIDGNDALVANAHVTRGFDIVQRASKESDLGKRVGENTVLFDHRRRLCRHLERFLGGAFHGILVGQDALSGGAGLLDDGVFGQILKQSAHGLGRLDNVGCRCVHDILITFGQSRDMVCRNTEQPCPVERAADLGLCGLKILGRILGHDDLFGGDAHGIGNPFGGISKQIAGGKAVGLSTGIFKRGPLGFGQPGKPRMVGHLIVFGERRVKGSAILFHGLRFRGSLLRLCFRFLWGQAEKFAQTH